MILPDGPLWRVPPFVSTVSEHFSLLSSVLGMVFLGDEALGLNLKAFFLAFFLSYEFLSFNLDFFHFGFKLDL